MKSLTVAMAVALAAPAQAQLVREADGNVVMRGGDLAVRFFPRFGGAILQAYKDGYGPLLNEIPGAAWQSAVRMGNDPTEASANGNLDNPIARIGDVASAKFGYYGRETIFDPASGVYERVQFAPDFWLSSEPEDDSIAENADGSDPGWRTPYRPGRFASVLNSASRPVIFEATASSKAGIFLVGDETGKDSAWANRLRRYEGGRIAFKVQVSLAMADDKAFAGVMFRRSIPAGAATRYDAYMAPGLTLAVNRKGGWAVTRMNPSGGESQLMGGTLSAAQQARLKGDGLQLELRTHNSRPGWAEVFFDDVRAGEFVDSMMLSGPHLGLIASVNSGYAVFGNRAVFDVGVEFVSRYSTWSGGIVSDITVRNAGGVVGPHTFDRANLPAVFLNTTTFPEGDRRIALYNGPSYPPTDVVPTSYPILGQYGFWAGNMAGTVGLLAVPEVITVDGQPAALAHCLLDTKSPSGEFVMMLNPLPADAFTEARELRLRARWQAHL